MSRTIAVLLALFAVSALATPHASAYEYLRDGGFESGAVGWHATGATVASVGASEIAPLSGARSGRVTLQSEAPFAIRQEFADVPAGSYTVSVGVRAGDAPVDARLTLVADGSGGQLQMPLDASASAWSTTTGTFSVAASADVRLIIEGTGAAGSVLYLDDVTFSGAPPATRTPTPTPSAPDIAASTTVTPAPSVTPSPTPTLASIGQEIVNRGFEIVGDDGAPAGWQAYGGVLSSAEAPVGGGSRAARLESSTASTKWLHQPLVVQPGATYSFGAWIYHDDPDVRAAFLRLSWYDSPDASGRAIDVDDSRTRLETPASEYRYLTTGPVQAPATARSVRLRVLLAPVSEAHAVIYVDDAEFGYAAPLPASTPTPVAVSAAADTGAAGASSAVLPAATDASTSARGATGTSGDLLISEVLYDPDAEGADGDNEWVEIHNRGMVDVNLAGWTLSDAKSGDELPPVTAPAGGFVVIAASDSFYDVYPEAAAPVAILGGRIGNGLGNDGDALVLRDPSGAPVDMLSWGELRFPFEPPAPDVPAGHSLERVPAGRDTDSAGDWMDNERPSPGAAPRLIEPQPQREPASGAGVEIIGVGGADRAWMPWAIAASSGSILLFAMAWRLMPVALHRIRART